MTTRHIRIILSIKWRTLVLRAQTRWLNLRTQWVKLQTVIQKRRSRQ